MVEVGIPFIFGRRHEKGFYNAGDNLFLDVGGGYLVSSLCGNLFVYTHDVALFCMSIIFNFENKKWKNGLFFSPSSFLIPGMWMSIDL